MGRFKVSTVFPGFPGRAELWGFGWGAVYLVESSEEAILVDTGGPAVTPYFINQLKQLGVTPECITKVFITHIHWDHAYNLSLFPNAQFIFSQLDYDAAKSKKDHAALYSAIEFLDESKTHIITQEREEIISGAVSIFTPGHTVGSISLVCDNGGEVCVLTGDAVKNRADLRSGFANGNRNDTISAESIRKVKEIANVVYPGHDGALRIEQDQVIALGGNDVKIMMPDGILVNNSKELILTLSDETE